LKRCLMQGATGGLSARVSDALASPYGSALRSDKQPVAPGDGGKTMGLSRLPPTSERARYVRQMFAAVAPRYDLLNHLLSGGLDHRWRSRAAAVCLRATEHLGHPLVLDVCCGTGDLGLAVLARRPAARLIACDSSGPMLARARRKLARAHRTGRAAVLESDALALPLADGCVDAVVCGFGLRNLADVHRGAAEMIRVLRPGGAVVILEFHRPQSRRAGTRRGERAGAPASAFGLYFRRILPRLGGWISGEGHGGYAYLVDSIEAFGPVRGAADLLRDAGAEAIRIEPLPGGIASVLTGRKPC